MTGSLTTCGRGLSLKRCGAACSTATSCKRPPTSWTGGSTATASASSKSRRGVGHRSLETGTHRDVCMSVRRNLRTKIGTACLLAVVLLAINLAKGESQGISASLHQWGAVTLFHGLPSDHVRAIAQDGEGVMWFATDGGLARYDGRRVQKVSDEALPSEQIRALNLEPEGMLWIGSDACAAVLASSQFKRIPKTEGHHITAICAPGDGRTWMTSSQGE